MVGEHCEQPEATDVGVPVLVAAAADQDDRGVWPVALGQRQLAGQDDVAVGEDHLLAAERRTFAVLARILEALQPEGLRHAGLGEFALDHPVAHFALPEGEPDG